MDIHKSLHDLRALAIQLDEHTQAIDVTADAELIVERASEIIERLTAIRDRCGIAPTPQQPSELQRQHDFMRQQFAPKSVTFQMGGKP